MQEVQYSASAGWTGRDPLWNSWNAAVHHGRDNTALNAQMIWVGKGQLPVFRLVDCSKIWHFRGKRRVLNFPGGQWGDFREVRARHVLLTYCCLHKLLLFLFRPQLSVPVNSHSRYSLHCSCNRLLKITAKGQGWLKVFRCLGQRTRWHLSVHVHNSIRLGVESYFSSGNGATSSTSRLA